MFNRDLLPCVFGANEGSVMSAEFWAIIGVGATLLVVLLGVISLLHKEINRSWDRTVNAEVSLNSRVGFLEGMLNSTDNSPKVSETFMIRGAAPDMEE
jgi:hypothetical protein